MQLVFRGILSGHLRMVRVVTTVAFPQLKLIIWYLLCAFKRAAVSQEPFHLSTVHSVGILIMSAPSSTFLEWLSRRFSNLLALQAPLPDRKGVGLHGLPRIMALTGTILKHIFPSLPEVLWLCPPGTSGELSTLVSGNGAASP